MISRSSKPLLFAASCWLLALTLLPNVVLGASFSADQIVGEIGRKTRTSESQKKQWELISNLGWKISLSNDGSGIQQGESVRLVPGKPLEIENLDTFKGRNDCKTLCIEVNSESSLTAKKIASLIVKEFFPKALSSKASPKAYRRLISSKAREATQRIEASFNWPEDQVDALGTGFDRYFEKRL